MWLIYDEKSSATRNGKVVLYRRSFQHTFHEHPSLMWVMLDKWGQYHRGPFGQLVWIYRIPEHNCQSTELPFLCRHIFKECFGFRPTFPCLLGVAPLLSVCFIVYLYQCFIVYLYQTQSWTFFWCRLIFQQTFKCIVWPHPLLPSFKSLHHQNNQSARP